MPKEYGILFVKTGCEKVIAEQMSSAMGNIEFLVPRKIRFRRVEGMRLEESVILFPGYLFFRTEDMVSENDFRSNKNILRLLVNGDRNWRLRGRDLEIAQRMYESDGIIGISKAIFVGNRIKIVEGFMKGMDADIIAVNKGKRTAKVRLLGVKGNDFTVWLGYECMDERSE